MSEEKEREEKGEKRKCPWCFKTITPLQDTDGNLYCPECLNYIEKRTTSHTVKVLRPEDVVHPSLQGESADEIVSASELGIDDSLEVVTVEEASARCPLIIENWEWRQSQFHDREFASMECVDKEGRRFVWNTSAWQPCRKLRVAEREGRKKILVRSIKYEMRGGRPVNIRIL